MAQQQRALKFTPPVMAKDQLVSRGVEAANLMQSPAFNLAYQSTVAAIQDQIINTQPHETQKREWLNLQVQALGAVIGELSAFVGEAKALTAKALAEEADRQRQQSEQRGFRVPEPGSGPMGLDNGYDGAYTGQ